MIICRQACFNVAKMSRGSCTRMDRRTKQPCITRRHEFMNTYCVAATERRYLNAVYRHGRIGFRDVGVNRRGNEPAKSVSRERVNITLKRSTRWCYYRHARHRARHVPRSVTSNE